MKKIVLASLLAIPAMALGQATPVGEFTGDFSEGFEDMPFGFFGTGVTRRAFDDNADFGAGPTGNMNVTSGWGFVCSIPAFEGGRFAGAASGGAQYDFAEGVSQFGGHMGSNHANPLPDGTAEFYDEFGTLIDTAPIEFNGLCGVWNWNGWEFSTPVYRVILRSARPGSDHLMQDAMQVNFGGATCRADIDGDGELTIFDFLEFQNLFAAGDLRADFDGDGQLTIFDFLQFQNEFAQGCD